MLEKNTTLSFLTFQVGSNLQNRARVLSLDSNENVVYVYENEKMNYCFKVGNPMDPTKTRLMKETDFLKEEEFNKKKLFISQSYLDNRQIEQIDFIIFDVSYSMRLLINNESKLSLSKSFFGAFIDKYVSFSFPYAIGVIFFGKEITCKKPLSRDYEKANQIIGSETHLENETKLFSALDSASSEIQKFKESNQNSLTKNLKSRILCLTDGESTEVFDPKQIDKLKSLNITVDGIIVDSKNDYLKAICFSTGGVCLNVNDKKTGLEIFESEAFLSLQVRKKNNHNPDSSYLELMKQDYTTTLEVEKPKEIFLKAVKNENQKSSNNNQEKGYISNRMKRIYYEFKTLKDDYEVFMLDDDFGFWKMFLHGEQGTPYANGIWVLYVKFPEEYPMKAPEIRFINKIYHCNISTDGKICHEILSTLWNPHVSMKKIFEEISDVLKAPNPDDSLDCIKGALYKEDKNLYNSEIKKWVLSYASNTKDELKNIYNLQ